MIKPDNHSERIASTWYTISGAGYNDQFDIDLGTDGQAHQLAVYCVDWDGNNARTQQLEIIDSLTGVVLDTRTISNFSNGVYVVWQIRGNVKVRVKKGAGNNAVVSGVFLGQSNIANWATYISTNLNRKGDWTGILGTDGYALANGSSNISKWTQFSITGQSSWTWADPTTDSRALLKATTSQNINPNDRLAATWFSPSEMSFSFNFTDRGEHLVSLYCVDWDYNNVRAQQFEVINDLTGEVVDSRTLNNFSGGAYVTWRLRGKVTIKVKKLNGANAIVSGVFFDSDSVEYAN